MSNGCEEMTKSEIMNCAAILAAGIMANDSSRTVYSAESAVQLMNQVAALIQSDLNDVDYF